MNSWGSVRSPNLLACFVAVEPGTQTLEQLDGHGTVETVEPANFFVPAPLLDPYAALEAARLTWCHAPAFRERARASPIGTRVLDTSH
jgi:hypothetical protein